MSKTVDVIKQKRVVSQDVKDKIKSFNSIKKDILKCLENEQKTIPQISKETNIPTETITYNLMTMLRYGYVVAGEVDDMDEYYFYNLKK
jgi:predicted transcriptional regulator